MPSTDIQKPTILVVDDSPTMLKMMVNTLDKHYHCLTATNGEECHKVAMEKLPKVILMDVVMPDKSGIEVASELREDPVSKDIPVVLVTSTKVSSDDLEYGLKSGAIDYIRRPFNDIELLARVASAVRLRESFESMKQQNDELQELNKMKTEFLAIASHDLRSPFTSILGLTEVLTDLMPDDLTKDQTEIIHTIHQSAETQLSYINDILSLAMNQRGGMNLKREEVDFSLILEGASAALRAISDNKKISVEVRGEKETYRIAADKVKIIQVINNLLTNAIKFSHEGSRIILAIADLDSKAPQWESIIPATHIEKARQHEKSLLVQIIDQGVGIPETEVAHLFQHYQQKNKRLGTKGEVGTGLGLAICKSIVELHGGVIWGERNRDGKGSTFGFTIPY